MYEKGRQAALEKYAVEWGRHFSNVREFMVGKPGAWGQLKSDAANKNLFGPGGSYASVPSWFIPHLDRQHPGQSALSFVNPALTALSLYGAATAPSEWRGSAIGNLLGNTLGAAAGTPFGMIGQTVGGTLGSMGGAAIGHLFDKSPTLPTYEQPDPNMPYPPPLLRE